MATEPAGQQDRPPLASVDADKVVKVGKVLYIVDTDLVVIESIRAMPPLDLDTILFDCDGKPLGQIYDVFGPITAPHYSIKFNNANEITEKGIEKEMAIYFAPQVDRSVTKFAFVNELQKIKGTDASWENDMEPPESVLEYSDDEEEELARRLRKVH